MDLEEDRALNTTGGRVCKRVSEAGVKREGAGESKGETGSSAPSLT